MVVAVLDIDMIGGARIDIFLLVAMCTTTEMVMVIICNPGGEQRLFIF